MVTTHYSFMINNFERKLPVNKTILPKLKAKVERPKEIKIKKRKKNGQTGEQTENKIKIISISREITKSLVHSFIFLLSYLFTIFTFSTRKKICSIF